MNVNVRSSDRSITVKGGYEPSRTFKDVLEASKKDSTVPDSIFIKNRKKKIQI